MRIIKKKRIVKKKRKLSFATKVFLSFTVFTLILIFTCLFSYPKLELHDEEITLDKSDDFFYDNYKAMVWGKDITNDVTITTNLKKEFGTYDATFTVFNGPFKTVKNLKVKVVDKESPVITLEGDSEVKLCKIEDYKEAGYKAIDNIDGDITNNVTVTKTNDYIYYSVKDSFGNETSIGRKVKIEDDDAPTINLKGSREVYLLLNNTYEEPGYIARDNCLGDITDKVEVTNDIDNTKTGTYTVTYKVSDNKNETVVKRTVYVVSQSDTKGVIYLTFDDGPGAYTNQILDVLKKYDIKATFFVTNGGSDDDILREYNEGHTVGLHTATHNYDIYKSVDTYFEDLNKVQDRVTRITGTRAKYIRFPGGSSNTISRSRCKGIMTVLTSKVKEEGYRYYDWNSLVEDAGACASRKVTDKNACVLKYFKDTISYNKINMVLLHDIKSYTANSLENMILYAKNQGYIFKAIDDNTPEIHQHINN